jgi:hypothetical protein
MNRAACSERPDVLIEQAAAHQRQAGFWLRRAGREAELGGPLLVRRATLDRAREHVVTARDLLQHAGRAAWNPGLRAACAQAEAALDVVASRIGELEDSTASWDADEAGSAETLPPHSSSRGVPRRPSTALAATTAGLAR